MIGRLFQKDKTVFQTHYAWICGCGCQIAMDVTSSDTVTGGRSACLRCGTSYPEERINE